MKIMKNPVLPLLLLAVVFKTHSLDLETSLIFGEVSPGFEASSGSVGFVNSVTVLPFTFQDKSGVGLTFSPFYSFAGNESVSRATFINPELFYNFFRDKYVRLGPFASINVLEMTDINFFKVTAGISFSWHLQADIFGNTFVPLLFEIVQVQAGYTYYENKGKFYMRIGFDLFAILFGAASEKNKSLYEKDDVPK
jgi:hypothetical protein